MKSRTKSRTTLFLLGALFLTGCYMFGQPGAVTNFLTGGNRAIATALEESAADWARHGLEIAKYVTIDDGRAGLPVRFTTTAEIDQYHPKGGAPVHLAVTAWEMGDWVGMLIDERLEADPAALLQVVKHEMIHALVPRARHLLEGVGIMTPVRTSRTITRADMDYLSQFTEVGPSEVPFEGEAA